jgi:hypothetical protein
VDKSTKFWSSQVQNPGHTTTSEKKIKEKGVDKSTKFWSPLVQNPSRNATTEKKNGWTSKLNFNRHKFKTLIAMQQLKEKQNKRMDRLIEFRSP